MWQHSYVKAVEETEETQSVFNQELPYIHGTQDPYTNAGKIK